MSSSNLFVITAKSGAAKCGWVLGLVCGEGASAGVGQWGRTGQQRWLATSAATEATAGAAEGDGAGGPLGVLLLHEPVHYEAGGPNVKGCYRTRMSFSSPT